MNSFTRLNNSKANGLSRLKDKANGLLTSRDICVIFQPFSKWSLETELDQANGLSRLKDKANGLSRLN